MSNKGMSFLILMFAVSQIMYGAVTLTETAESTPENSNIIVADRSKNDLVSEVKEENVRMSAEEKELLARVVFTEARGESFEVKKKVASVVLNRKESLHFPDSVKGVVYQKDQFLVDEEIPLDTPIDVAYPYPTDEESRRAVQEVSRSGSVLPREVLVFYASYCEDEWLNSRPTYERVDDTVFAYLR